MKTDVLQVKTKYDLEQGFFWELPVLTTVESHQYSVIVSFMSGTAIDQINVSEVNVNPCIKKMWLSLNLAHNHKHFGMRLTCKESELLEKCFVYFYFTCIAIFVQQYQSRTKIPSDYVIGDALCSPNPANRLLVWLSRAFVSSTFGFLVRTLVQTYIRWPGLWCSPKKSTELKAHWAKCHKWHENIQS